MSVLCIGQTCFNDVRAGCDTKCVFCDVDSDINRFRHGYLPYLQMRTRRTCGSAAVQTAVRVCPTGATRITLCDGLEDPVAIDLSSPIDSARCAPRFAGV